MQDPDKINLSPRAQSWQEYDEGAETWAPVPSADETSLPKGPKESVGVGHSLVLATWNVNCIGPQPGARLGAIFSHIVNHAPSPDIIFFQEVSRPMIGSLLCRDEVRRGWYSSERDSINWISAFATVILLSKARFGPVGTSPFAILGRLSRIRYPSMMRRDALCGDIFVPTKRAANSSSQPHYIQVRLVNVHLESKNLPDCASYRAGQLSVAASMLHKTVHGLVAGDFNPVDPRDETVIEDNGLQDAWTKLRGGEAGCTWGVDGRARYPATRMDKVAILGLMPLHIEVMHPQKLPVLGLSAPIAMSNHFDFGESKTQGTTAWSDHSGLKFTFKLDGDESD
ncbi:Putative Endonuclease/exonuclease/phosphatase superfamily [Colletotrichum destructivum]|uniref:Endonuclease/exonuclease/phosphatase superfamily n=1 Tax=Colletotrichum destructivum TaxID=34406 RepID=A0AAX4II35_9PEZI|nr:Putative Endonuclease/exonuclease/phosphatase superfamily [Colletotrichum destructivum]